MPRDVLTPEFAGRGTSAGARPAAAQRIEIPGIGIVEFPASMSEAEVNAAAAKLHAETNTQTASAEQFTPAPRMTRLEGDPSTGGFVGNLLSGAKDAVTNLPKTIKGLTKINPLELPGQIATGISDRVQSYADDPLSTIYDDPLSFLGDVATVTGIGAAASAPLRAGARGAANAALKAGPALGTAADVGLGAAKGALESKAFGGSAIRGAVRGGAERFATRAKNAASATASPVDELAEGYDRYMPNTSAQTAPAPPAVPSSSRLPAEFGPDAAAGPSIQGAYGQSIADDAFARYTARGMTPEPRQQLAEALTQTAPPSPRLLPKRAFSLQEAGGPYLDDPRAPMAYLRAQEKFDVPEIPEITPNLTRAGQSMLTAEERAKLARALQQIEYPPVPTTTKRTLADLTDEERLYGERARKYFGIQDF